MQDLRSIPGVAARIFGISGGGGGAEGGGGGDAAALDRRLRPYPQQQNLKCPRCESLNTKFCYYNNYNLSQPRHFCKSCRRYWTKGGVLRNVPVGGGCRKSKRSASSSSKSSSHEPKDNRRSAPAPTAEAAVTSRSSSESSSLTAGASDASAPQKAPAPNPGFDPSVGALLETTDAQGQPPPASAAEIFPGTGGFTGLIAAASNPGFLGLNYANVPANIPEFQLHPQQPAHPPEMMVPPPPASALVEEIKIAAEGFMDQTVSMGLHPLPLQSRLGAGGGGLTGLDWLGCMDPTAGLFDLTGAVDQGGFWNQGHWGETDPSLYLP